MTPAAQEAPRPRRRRVCDGCGGPITRAFRPMKKATGRRLCLDCGEFESGRVSPDWDC
jgi:hypothetical protein